MGPSCIAQDGPTWYASLSTNGASDSRRKEIHISIPEKIQFAAGALEVSREAVVEINGELRSPFQENTIVVKVTHDGAAASWIVYFPIGWLSWNRSRDDLIATALFGAGSAYARGEQITEVLG